MQILLLKNLLLNSKEEILKEINLVFKVLNSELNKTLNKYSKFSIQLRAF